MKQNIKAAAFLLCFVLAFAGMDHAVSLWAESAYPRAENDFEVTKVQHPEEVWDKVFFGNSTVIAGYREDISTSGYVNLGMDYAVVTDLWQILKKGHMDVGSELVIGLNLFALYDEFDTDPSYIWHRKALEPYTYFHRDKVLKLVKDEVKKLLGEEVGPYARREKILYFGNLSDEQLAEKLATYNERYYHLPIEKFQKNIRALDKIADWCEEQDVRLRILWMPNNPSVGVPELMVTLQEQVDDWCVSREIEVKDMTYALDESCFHDVGHLNYEHGAYIFTKEADEWLQK